MNTTEQYSEKSRTRAIQRIEHWLRNKRSPRLDMLFIVFWTGLSGFLASFLMLHLGLSIMWMRYPLAIGCAYLMFLALLWFWLRFQQRSNMHCSFDDAANPNDIMHVVDMALDEQSLGKVELAGDTPTSASAADIAESLDLDGCVLIAIVITALFGALALCGYLVWLAPSFLAEILVDAVLMSKIYGKLRLTDRPHWSRTTIRHTLIPVLLLAVCFAVGGLMMQMLVPSAQSIGPVVEHFFLRLR